jgi:AcrR family transcriptional regulator
MPRRPHSLDSSDILTDGVMDLLAESGATGMSMRRLAGSRGISVGALTNKWGTRARILHVAINTFRHRWNMLIGGLSWTEGVTALLPATPEDVDDCRIWHAFCDLARTDDVLAECVLDQRREERELVRALVRRKTDDEATADLLIALVDGLRTALCSPEPMTVDRARELLDAHLRSLGLHAADLGLHEAPDFLFGS